MNLYFFLIKITFFINVSNGLYIKNTGDNKNNRVPTINHNAIQEDEWDALKQKLGLTNQKVELLKSQKDQRGTLELLHRFLEENPNYNTNKVKTEETKGKPSTDSFSQVYRNLIKQLQLSRRTLKTSLNFELADKPQKELKRTRRKIAVKMVSDVPSNKIDELIKIFNEKHGIDKQDGDDDDASDADNNYIDFPLGLPSAMDPDYMYENLYEDEGDLAVPAKSNHNSQYGSFQDLILQATRNQWQREVEETKLRNRSNEHFI